MAINEEAKKEFYKLLNEINKTEFFTDEALKIVSTFWEQSLVFSKKNYLTEKKFIMQAKRDLQVTELLYDKKLYAHATYNLQQAAEKITKAWCLFAGFIEEKELTEVSHKTPRAFLKALKSKIGNLAIQLIKSSKSNYTIEINMLEEIINKKTDEISRLKHDDIISMFEAVTNIEHILNNEFYKYVNIISKKAIKEIVNIMMAFSWIYILSIITFPHVETTRYPDTKGRKNALNPSDYTLELGIVKATPKILPHLNRSINTLSSLLDIAN